MLVDKTGSGDYDIAKDIGIIGLPACKPIVLAIYTARNKQEAKSRDGIVAATTNILFNEFAINDRCISYKI